VREIGDDEHRSFVVLLTDSLAATPRGTGHLLITLPTGGVTWFDLATNIYNWNGENFDSYVPGCATSIGVGPDSRGLTDGTPWITGCHHDAHGNYTQMHTGGAWVEMQHAVGLRIAVSPDQGIAWAVSQPLQ
jgi:hypothetical protein